MKNIIAIICLLFFFGLAPVVYSNLSEEQGKNETYYLISESNCEKLKEVIKDLTPFRTKNYDKYWIQVNADVFCETLQEIYDETTTREAKRIKKKGEELTLKGEIFLLKGKLTVLEMKIDSIKESLAIRIDGDFKNKE